MDPLSLLISLPPTAFPMLFPRSVYCKIPSPAAAFPFKDAEPQSKKARREGPAQFARGGLKWISGLFRTMMPGREGQDQMLKCLLLYSVCARALA